MVIASLLCLQMTFGRQMLSVAELSWFTAAHTFHLDSGFLVSSGRPPVPPINGPMTMTPLACAVRCPAIRTGGNLVTSRNNRDVRLMFAHTVPIFAPDRRFGRFGRRLTTWPCFFFLCHAHSTLGNTSTTRATYDESSLLSLSSSKHLRVRTLCLSPPCHSLD